MLMEIDPSAPTPLYAQVAEALVAQIQAGALPSGHQLPPEESLVEQFTVSRTTVRAAVQNLLQRGLVEIRRGKGTFVSHPKIVQELTELTGFVEDMTALGRTATARVLAQKIVSADTQVARQLGIEEGSLVVHIRRVRITDGSPLSLDETYLPLELGRQVMAHDLEREPIFPLLENQYDTPLIEAEYRLEARTASPEIAHALDIIVGSPIFLIERTSYSTGHRPVDYEQLFYRGDHIRFVTRLTRRPLSRQSGPADRKKTL